MDLNNLKTMTSSIDPDDTIVFDKNQPLEISSTSRYDNIDFESCCRDNMKYFEFEERSPVLNVRFTSEVQPREQRTHETSFTKISRLSSNHLEVIVESVKSEIDSNESSRCSIPDSDHSGDGHTFQSSIEQDKRIAVERARTINPLTICSVGTSTKETSKGETVDTQHQAMEI